MKWAVLLVAGCSFHHGSASGDGGGNGSDALPPGEHWIVDTASDFGAGTTSALDIEAVGAITPTGYVYGELFAHGLQGTELWNTGNTNPQWSDTTTVTPSGAGMWDAQYTTTADSYANLGVVTNDVFSLWFEGDIYLDANDELMVDADGAAFVDILGANGTWTTVVASRTTGQQVSAAFPSAGWYTMRMGYGEGTGSGHLDFRRGPAGSFVPFTRDRLRANTSRIAGTMRATFFRQIFGGASANAPSPVMQLAPDALLPQTALPPAPPGASTLDWSARWFGQIYVPTAGSYTFLAQSDAGNRISVAGYNNAMFWSAGDAQSATNQLTVNLTQGWNDLALDYTHVSGPMSLLLYIADSPEVTNSTIPPDRLRVVEPRRDRLITRSAVAAAPLTIQNDNGTPGTLSTDVTGFPTETITSIEVTVRLTTQHENQLVFTLTPPGGSPIAIQTHDGGDTNLSTAYIEIPVTTGALIGVHPAGTWTLGVADNVVGGNTSSLQEFHVTFHTSGGPEQIALAGTWISSVFDATTPATVIDVTWSEHAPFTLMPSDVYVRSCDAADCSDQTDWGAPVPKHTAPQLAPRRYLQARIDMHSDGTTSPELDELAITYNATQ